jgi:branched-chain amino acid transport system permease protein
VSSLDLARNLYLLLAALGLNLVLGYAGQPVLGQGAFVATGAYGVALLTARAHLPLGVAWVAAAVVAGLAGWLVGHGAARLRGAFLALATWAAAWLAYSVVVAFPGVFGGAQGLVRAAPAHLVSPTLGVDWALTPRWHVAIAGGLCVLVGGWTRTAGRGTVGRSWAALRGSPAVAASLGVDVAPLRRGTLAVAAAIGGLAGAGSTVLQGLVSPAEASPLVSIELFVAVLIGGTAHAWGPVVGVAVLAALPAIADAAADASGTEPERGRGLLTALLLIAVLAARSRVAAALGGIGWRGGRFDAAAERPAAIQDATRSQASAPGSVALAGRGLVRRFGQVRAVDGVDVDVRLGEIHALVGPNGSGKSTLLRLLAGALRADAGTVEIHGHDATGAGQAERVRLGVARTFQNTVLIGGLGAADQVLVGAGAGRGVGAVRTLFGTPTARLADARASAAARDAAAAVGLVAAGGHPDDGRTAAALAFGEQRLLQLARAVATGASVLLLDEPAAGMSAAELERLAAAVRALADSGRGVLIVEHNMRLVASLADRMTVLAEGRVLASGAPASVLADPAVRAAYLGAGG